MASDLTNPQPVVTGINGSWIVPTITAGTGNTYAAEWIGIGGLFRNDATLIQCGTGQDAILGRVSYYAWYEMLPAFSITIPTIFVSPGDQMQASIQLVAGTSNQWNLSIADLTSNTSYQNLFRYTSSKLSAEWIVERPQINNQISPLANFGNVTFTNCSATVGSTTAGIDSFPANEVLMYSQPGGGGAQIADVSPTRNSGKEFTVTYLG